MRVWFLALSLLASSAWAFPELVRHGYATCNACHVSPTGGGVLTAYGRSLSAELLSTWSAKGEEKFVYGLFNLPENVQLGGDIRSLQYHRDTPRVTQGNWIFMQTDLDAAVTLGKFTFSGTLGFEQGKKTFETDFLSRRHFISYAFNDDTSLRFGRFYRAFGLQIPDHNAFTRSQLGFEQGAESYNVEYSHAADPYEYFLTAVLGRIDRPSIDSERGLAFRVGRLFSEQMKVGASYLFGRTLTYHRHAVGPWIAYAPTSKLALLAEMDFQYKKESPENEFGAVQYLKASYEVTKGLSLYVTEEWSKLDFDTNTAMQAYGVGAQWFPRPHLEFNLYYQKQKVAAAGNYFIDFAALLLHYYL